MVKNTWVSKVTESRT